MAIGDDAAAAGYPLVPETGEEGKVKWGAREINRTRDFIASAVALTLQVWPIARGGTGATSKAGARSNFGITSGTATPSNSSGANGDIYFKIV